MSSLSSPFSIVLFKDWKSAFRPANLVSFNSRSFPPYRLSGNSTENPQTGRKWETCCREAVLPELEMSLPPPLGSDLLPGLQ